MRFIRPFATGLRSPECNGAEWRAIADKGLPARLAPQPKESGKTNMALYEHVIITRPDISPAQVDSFIEEISTFLKEQGASVGKSEYWGLRNLAYPINKVRKGHYSLLNIDAPSSALQELERRHRINDDVMRYMSVKVDVHDEEPSPVLSRKDRGDRDRKPRH